ncbi:P-loop containing nucleoside triphosphate hydrolase protein [Pelagophyceae sp. CCMP2097]|nr:P-loop containing nucleoside triphosphate hydrolase protein [Pelagophyceae sp. CCMP2097]
MNPFARGPSRAAQYELADLSEPFEASNAEGPQKPLADDRTAGPWSTLTFSWMYPLLSVGASRPLQRSDLGSAPLEDCSSKHASDFEREWAASGSTFTALRQTFYRRMWQGVACKFLADLCGYAQVFAVKAIVTYAEYRAGGGAETSWSAQRVAGPLRAVDASLMLLFACPALQGLGNHWFYHHVMVDGLHARSALKAALFRKLLRVPGVWSGPADGGARESGGSGKILNLQNTDARAVENVYHMILYLAFVPIQLSVYLYLLASEIGLATCVGLGVMILAVPVQLGLSCCMKRAQRLLFEAADERVRGVKETVGAIFAVKIFGWESAFSKTVFTARQTELRHGLRLATLQAWSSTAMEAMPILCAFASLSAYGLFYPDRPLTASSAFVSLLVFNQLRQPLMMLPTSISLAIAGLAACHRIDGFLSAPEVRGYVEKSAGKETVRVRNATFAWPCASPSDFKLENLTMDLDPGSLTVIVGAVASGKSMLLNALLGEVSLEQGAVQVTGSVAVCPQVPWIFNATLRANVVFGLDFEKQRYEDALEACALLPDLATLPAGDATEIGERGVTLSGGQKARVSLARAVYANADLVLLDDVFAAVDWHVGQHLRQRVLRDSLLDKGKTVVLVSHSFAVIGGATRVIVLENGRVSFDGTPADAFFHDALKDLRGADDGANGQSIKVKVKVEREAAPAAEAATFQGARSFKAPAQAASDGSLTVTEDRVTGSVSLDVLHHYASLCGGLAFFVVALLLIKTVSAVLAQAWVATWTAAAAKKEAKKEATGGHLSAKATLSFVRTYAVLSAFAVACIVAQQLAAVTAARRASARIHAKAFDAVIRAPLAYFDSTPPGRLLARFGNDVNVVDTMLMTSLNGTAAQLVLLCATLALNAFLVPWLLPLTLPVLLAYGKLAKVYRSSSRELKRLENIAESPVYSGFASTMDGLVTIRAFQGAGKRSVKQAESAVDDWVICWLRNNCANRWMGMRLDCVGAAVVGLTALLCVLRVEGQLGSQSDFPAGRVGLMLSFAASASSVLNWCVRGIAEAEQNATSLERILAVSDIEAEEWGEAESARGWCGEGRVEFTNVSMRYRPEVAPVLEGVSFSIQGGQRMGICGRTGSGKSSLVKCLFRLVHFQGEICIDGRSAKSLPLKQLRAGLAMVQQDPQLFAGSLRYNVDPTCRFSKAAIAKALQAASLGHLTLDSQIEEGGANLSAGEKQLLCLARVLLVKPKVLVLDEATSSLDRRTSDVVQSAILNELEGVTILAIAHRLETLMDYDTVVVLANGRVEEVGNPHQLANRPGGAFRALLSQASSLAVL